MLPPAAASLFGAVIASEFAPLVAATHALAIGLAAYTAHVKNGYVDFYGRGEDDDHPLTRRGCRYALVGAGIGFAAATGALWLLVGAGAALLTLPTWAIGYLHAPQLDTNPVTTTLGYPAGVALAIVGGTYAQAAAVPPRALGFGLVFLATLAGVKIIDDEQDYEYDRSIDKHSVSVALGPVRTRRLAYGLLVVGILAVPVGATIGPFPASAVVASVAFGAVAAVAAQARAETATMLLVRGAYVFLAYLVAAVWFEPLG